MTKGKLIVFYGINNLGKSTQAKLLVQKIIESGKKAEYIKFPIYDLKPSGPILNEYLRQGNPHKLTPREAQFLYAYNRMHFRPRLEEILNSGTNTVAEDYWGTGVAWGMGAGAEKDLLLDLNKPFQSEDLALLLHGERFDTGREKGHLHEDNDKFMKRVRTAHVELGMQYSWKRIDANKSIEEVGSEIWQEVEKIL